MRLSRIAPRAISDPSWIATIVMPQQSKLLVPLSISCQRVVLVWVLLGPSLTRDVVCGVTKVTTVFGARTAGAGEAFGCKDDKRVQMVPE